MHQIGEPWLCAGNRYLGYAMEYLPGMRKGESPSEGDWCLLQDWLQADPPEEVWVGLCEVARQQLKAAHALQVDFGPCSSTAVHGDLRPCNIAVRQTGVEMRISFLDFGFAGPATTTDGLLEQAR